MTPFDLIKTIYTKKNPYTYDEIKKNYNSYLINDHFSLFSDTIFLSNEMNKMHKLPKNLQFLFLLNIVSKRNSRFVKMNKPGKNLADDIEVVKEYYGYSNAKAKEVLPLLNKEQLEQIRVKVSRRESGKQ
jgi:hypothetical protein